MGVCALGILTVPIFVRKNYDIFEPLSFVLLAVFVGVTLKTIYVVFGINDWVKYNVLLGKSPEFLLNTSLLVVIGIACLVSGYLLRVPSYNLSRWSLMD